MKMLCAKSMENISCSSWKEGVSCIGGAMGWGASLIAFGMLTGGIGLGVVAVISFAGNGILTSVSCAQWAMDE